MSLPFFESCIIIFFLYGEEPYRRLYHKWQDHYHKWQDHYHKWQDHYRKWQEEQANLKILPCDRLNLPDSFEKQFQTPLHALCSKEKYQALFPARYGTWIWQKVTHQKAITDYYSYENLQNAIRFLSQFQCKILRQPTGEICILRINKTTQASQEVWRDPKFSNHNNYHEIEVDFSQFLTEGSQRQRLTELAAFFAQIAYETGGGSARTLPGGPNAWGLTWNSEIGKKRLKYIQTNHPLAPAQSGQYYYGRGPIQLTWNFNYAKISAILFGDRTYLLKNPNLVCENGAIGFATAIIFWMLPQDNKPSCHQVMTQQWIPSKKDLKEGRKKACFGITTLIINGGEKDCDETDRRIAGRASFYRFFRRTFGLPSSSHEKIDTKDMQAF